MKAELVAFRDAAVSAPSARLRKLRVASGDALREFEAALVTSGVIRQYAGMNGYTDTHRLLDELISAQLAVDHYLEMQLAKTSAQLERVLDNEAFSDPAARQAVISTVVARGKNVADRLLYTQEEQELIACYRRMRGNDRSLFRSLLRRLGSEEDA